MSAISKNRLALLRELFRSTSQTAKQRAKYLRVAGDMGWVGLPLYEDAQSIEVLDSRTTLHFNEQRKVQKSHLRSGKLAGQLSMGNLIQALQLPSGELDFGSEKERGQVEEISFSIPTFVKVASIIGRLEEDGLLRKIDNSETIIDELRSGPVFVTVADLFKMTNMSTPLVVMGRVYPFNHPQAGDFIKYRVHAYGSLRFQSVSHSPKIAVNFGAEHIRQSIYHWLRGTGEIFEMYAECGLRNKWPEESQNLLVSAMGIFGLAHLASLSPPLVRIKPLFAEAGSLGLQPIEDTICPICNQQPITSMSFGRSKIDNSICDACQVMVIKQESGPLIWHSSPCEIG